MDYITPIPPTLPYEKRRLLPWWKPTLALAVWMVALVFFGAYCASHDEYTGLAALLALCLFLTIPLLVLAFLVSAAQAWSRGNCAGGCLLVLVYGFAAMCLFGYFFCYAAYVGDYPEGFRPGDSPPEEHGSHFIVSEKTIAAAMK